MTLNPNDENNIIVIGRHLNAALYAYYNNLPLLIVGDPICHPFDFYKEDYDLGCLNNISRIKYKFKTPEGIITHGIQKRKIHCQINVLLSLTGYLPYSRMIEELTILDDNVLRIHLKQELQYDVKFKELIIFDDDGIKGLPISSQKGELRKIQVLDWYIITKRGSDFDIEIIKRNEDFLREIYFYPSVSLDGNLSRKNIKMDCLAVSIFNNANQLKKYEYSDLSISYKIIKIMKKYGLDGMKMEADKREIFPIMKKYNDTENLKFIYASDEEIFEEMKNATYESEPKIMADIILGKEKQKRDANEKRFGNIYDRMEKQYDFKGFIRRKQRKNKTIIS